MVILHLLASNKYSGAENVAISMINIMKDENEIYYCSPKGEICDVLKKNNINYIELKKCDLKNMSTIIKKINPDIIHAHDFKMSVLASFFGKKATVISHIHKNDPAMKKLTLKSLIYLIACKKFKKIICVSKKINEEWIVNKIYKDKIEIVYNIIDIGKVKKNNEKIYDILYVGRMSEEKNPLLFIDIIKKINDNSLKVIMIGDGDLSKIVREQAKRLNISYLGYIPEPYEYMSKAKIMIVPSKWEGFGLTAIEGIANDAYVLNSGMGGLSEIFCNNPEYICGLNAEKYIYEINEILYKGKKMKQVNIEKFTDKNKWKERIISIYEYKK